MLSVYITVLVTFELNILCYLPLEKLMSKYIVLDSFFHNFPPEQNNVYIIFEMKIKRGSYKAGFQLFYSVKFSNM